MKLSVNKGLLLIVILGILVLATPQVLRYFLVGDVLIGEKPYYFLRVSNFIHEFKEIPTYDSLSYGGREIASELGWPLLLSPNPMFFSKLLPFLFGIGSLILFYFILIKLKKEIAFLASLLLLLSPPFIYLFSVSNKFVVPIFLSLLGFYFLINKKYFLTIICFTFISFFSILVAILMLILFFIYSIEQKIKFSWSIYLFILLLISSFLQLYTLVFKLGFPEILKFTYKETGINFLFQKLVSEIGGVYGLSFFLIILSLVGAYGFWKEKYKYIYYYLILVILFILAIYFDFIIFYLDFILVVLASYGLINLYKREWESKLIMKLIFIVFIVGLLLSSIFYVFVLVNSAPNKEVFDAYYYLNRKPDEEVVFSHYTRGFWILGAEKADVMDSNFFYAPNVNKRYEDSEMLLYGQDLGISMAIIEKYHIKYIWIDKWLKQELWDGETKGLLYLIKNSDNFKLLFSNDSVEVYRVLDES